MKYYKHILILTTIILSFALAGCGGKVVDSGDNEPPEVPLEEPAKRFEEGIYQEVEEDSRKESNIIVKEKVPYTPEEAEEIISERAGKVLNLIAGKDMKGLVEYVHPVKGVRFSPYSYVDINDNVVFMPSDFEGYFSSSVEYNWGNYDGSGEPIILTPAAYYDIFIYDQDFRNAEKISYNKQLFQGSMINNAPDAYPGSIIVEYHFDGFDPKYEGLDWRSLRLVFEEFEGEWLLVGIIHDQWTI